MSDSLNRRILLVDDMPTIHQDFRKILQPDISQEAELGDMELALFGEQVGPKVATFDLDSAYGGQEALAMLGAALREGRPYAMAFVDMRMPQGWNGVETIEHLWTADPRLQVVICTAYSDFSWEEVQARLDVRDRLLILKKPFDNIEVCQMANTLTAKWEMERRAELQMALLEERVQQRTLEISRANDALHQEIEGRKQLEGQLLQSEKMATIGQLAAGIAHEINNPMSYISANFGVLERYFPQLLELLDAYQAVEQAAGSDALVARLGSLRERAELDFLQDDIPLLLSETRGGIDRVCQIVRDLKDFSRIDAAQEWQWANLHQGIDSTLNIVASELKYKADVIKEYGGIPDIECLPAQLNQVVMNLVVNAAQAMGTERGRIIIRTGAEEERVWLEVVDSGSGIAADDLSRIFDPFFTTKPMGKGTGLGLTLSSGIVHKHGGEISVTSTRGMGATFRISLPIRQPKSYSLKTSGNLDDGD
jgi:signal transduction histidine kinase